ncbi:conserved hypothetical protein [Shewanella halifaxensis HAW-EB4]|uniref:Uncharacterized protein n=1 Tax=Shewanella halifaxensis (strain HAW-EB4) TaxID=458817 RepID=B0TLM8_SHEHH|nr:hypothetical protein [Shewanella halifaxensis]ABZ75978.1 conserved hypothetical protein [Shewanella halifaxensis HAW-EB4]
MCINAIRPSAGLDKKSLLTAMESATSMVLHAAIYTNFAHSEVGNLIRRKLLDGSLHRLDIIELQPDLYWRDEFVAILRPNMTKDEVILMFAESKRWSEALSFDFPKQVNQVLTQALPLQPIMLIGDCLFVGQYAHSRLVSAQGLWLQIECSLMGLQPGELQSWYQQGLPAEVSGDWQQVISRYVDECRQAAQFSSATTPSTSKY